MNYSKIILLGISSCFIFPSLAQKRALNHTDYDSWQNINNLQISPTGQFMLYHIDVQEGDGNLMLQAKNNRLIQQIPRGYKAQLTNKEDYLVASIKPAFQESRKAKIKKTKAEDMPKDSLVVYGIQADKRYTFPHVKSWQLAQEAQGYVAFLSDISLSSANPKDSKDSTKTKAENSTSVLHLLHLATGDTLQFPKADAYAWSPNEQYIVFSKTSAEKDSVDQAAGVYIYDITAKKLKKISQGKGVYKGFTFDDQSMQLGFLADKTAAKSLQKTFNLYYYTATQDTAKILVSQSSQGVPQRWQPSGDAQLFFSQNGESLYFGLAPIPKVRDTSLVDFEHAKVDIWHWQDDFLQPQQLVNLKKDLAKSYLAIVKPKQGSKVTPLSDLNLNRIVTTDEANNEWVLASSDFGNRIAYQWTATTLSDLYVVSTRTSAKKLVTSKLDGQSYLSPKGDYVVFFNREKGQWFSFDILKETSLSLNKDLPVNFSDEENDSPDLPSSYGLAGWSTDGKGIYLNDRYDLWYFSLNGKERKLVTNGQGRIQKLIFRYIPLIKSKNPRYQTKLIDPKSQIFLRAFDETSKYNGLFTVAAGKSSAPKELLFSPHTYKQIVAADDAKTFAYTKEDYSHSPAVFSNEAFQNETQLSQTNQQQAQINWGTAELVQWTTPAGHQAEGILYKPENFDPQKKYPIIAYFYEKLSEGLYSYHPPAPTPSRLNIPYFVSNEYLVFVPDIKYEIGYPGKSAEEYVNSGMQHLSSFPWVDAQKMGLQGQSWGGYQVAHLITRGTQYAAAWAGAPVVNMTSAYGAIRWQSGMSRQFQYEKTQSRLGKTLWEDLDLYVENSPLFHFPKVQTPVVIMANDNDGAVPWYQGIEMFTALRRLGKPVWMLNYNNEAHNLMERQNRKDIQIREAQFFDHYLKGKPAPKWLSKGIPATDKGIDWGFDSE